MELRQSNISSHAVVLRAIGGIGADLMRDHPGDWKSRLQDLGTIDWKKSNRDWENICIVAGSVVSNRQARLATKAYLKQHLGLSLSDSERKSLPEPALAGRRRGVGNEYRRATETLRRPSGHVDGRRAAMADAERVNACGGRARHWRGRDRRADDDQANEGGCGDSIRRFPAVSKSTPPQFIVGHVLKKKLVRFRHLC